MSSEGVGTTVGCCRPVSLAAFCTHTNESPDFERVGQREERQGPLFAVGCFAEPPWEVGLVRTESSGETLETWTPYLVSRTGPL